MLRQLVKDEFGLDMVVEPKIEDLEGIYNQFENVNFELKPDDNSTNKRRSDSKNAKQTKASYSRHNEQKQDFRSEHYESSMLHDK